MFDVAIVGTNRARMTSSPLILVYSCVLIRLSQARAETSLGSYKEILSMLLDLCRNRGRFLFLVSLRLPLAVKLYQTENCSRARLKTSICFYLFTWPPKKSCALRITVVVSSAEMAQIACASLRHKERGKMLTQQILVRFHLQKLLRSLAIRYDTRKGGQCSHGNNRS